MKIESNDQITIKLTVDELASSIALLSSTKEFCDEQEEVSEGKTDTSAALTVALEPQKENHDSADEQGQGGERP